MASQKSSDTISYFLRGDFHSYQELFAAVCPPPMKMNKGMRLCSHGEISNWMYYICHGKLKIYSSNCEGNDRLVAILGDGCIAGLDLLLPGLPAQMTMECMTDCWLYAFQNTFLETLIRENPDFAVTLNRYYCKVVRQLCFDAANQSISNVFIRLSNFLMTNWNDTTHNKVELNQQELADAISCSRASISRICKILKDENVIKMDGIGFHILDLSKLSELCHKYEHLC